MALVALALLVMVVLGSCAREGLVVGLELRSVGARDPLK